MKFYIVLFLCFVCQKWIFLYEGRNTEMNISVWRSQYRNEYFCMNVAIQKWIFLYEGRNTEMNISLWRSQYRNEYFCMKVAIQKWIFLYEGRNHCKYHSFDLNWDVVNAFVKFTNRFVLNQQLNIQSWKLMCWILVTPILISTVGTFNLRIIN